jgi:CDP-6-deoxy-D-xylo-4-hexulose-3-dehydrase
LNTPPFQPGDIVVLQDPATSGPKALVLTTTEDGDCLVAAIQPAGSASPASVEVTATDLVSGTLAEAVLIRVDRLSTLPPSSLAPVPCGSLSENKLRDVLKRWNAVSVRTFSRRFHAAQKPAPAASVPFVPGATTVPYAGRVFTEEEVEAAVGTTLDFWLTLGPEGEAFEKELAALLGVKHSLLVNSGSSANLVALSALTTHKLPAHKRLQPGDEVITCAAGFPTTVAPILQNGMVPVFVDNNPVTGNALVEQFEAAFVPGKTKAVMLAHALGNPFDLGAVMEFCRRHDLWLVEDNCDALGCTYSMPKERAKALGFTENSPGIPASDSHITRYTGTWGDLSTQSFYPPHHLTMGEGGAVNIVHRPPLKSYAESFRDWGRDCWCPSGKDNTCNKRFCWQLGELPEGYDHKYIYSHLGYNLKPLDPQAAIGRCQLRKLPAFIEARKQNWNFLRAGLADLEEFFDFSLPTHATGWSKAGFSWDATGSSTDCSWFGFMLRVRANAPFTHSQLGRHLDENKIGNRMLFGGNLLRQPVFVQLRKDRPESFRVIGDTPGADLIMNTALFLGTYPGLTEAMLQYEVDILHSFVRSRVG